MEARHSTLRVEEAEDVVKELRAALAKAGITPPSPGHDPVSPAREVPRPLVEPGRCSVGTARRIAAVVR
ncbi:MULTISPECIES: hypothetical protein [Streptomyces]|uniref:Uncharacterized protein n=1 Tax=Streptomyces edwardsiae TaxID=3075527 RepID=A0ABU2PNQ4_9ACTN|nr:MULTISPECIES: hypothetical protein [unclassified Streptomyces]MDT0393797.1 hypothetical protein [Streptomyces sp. DSM 41636]